MLVWFSAFFAVCSRIFLEEKDETRHTNCVDLQIGLTRSSKDREGEIGSGCTLLSINGQYICTFPSYSNNH